MGEGATFWDHKKIRVSCKEYGEAMSAPSLSHHMDIAHWIVLTQTQGVYVGGGGPETYLVFFLRVMK